MYEAARPLHAVPCPSRRASSFLGDGETKSALAGQHRGQPGGTMLGTGGEADEHLPTRHAALWPPCPHSFRCLQPALLSPAGAGAESPTNDHPPAFPSAGRAGRRWPIGWLKEGRRDPARMASSCLHGAWTWLGSTRTDRGAPSAGHGCPTSPQRASLQAPQQATVAPAGGWGQELASEVTAARAPSVRLLQPQPPAHLEMLADSEFCPHCRPGRDSDTRILH